MRLSFDVSEVWCVVILHGLDGLSQLLNEFGHLLYEVSHLLY